MTFDELRAQPFSLLLSPSLALFLSIGNILILISIAINCRGPSASISAALSTFLAIDIVAINFELLSSISFILIDSDVSQEQQKQVDIELDSCR